MPAVRIVFLVLILTVGKDMVYMVPEKISQLETDACELEYLLQHLKFVYKFEMALTW